MIELNFDPSRMNRKCERATLHGVYDIYEITSSSATVMLYSGNVILRPKKEDHCYTCLDLHDAKQTTGTIEAAMLSVHCASKVGSSQDGHGCERNGYSPGNMYLTVEIAVVDRPCEIKRIGL